MRALVGAVFLALPGAAQAGTVRLVDEVDDRSSTTTQELVYEAAPGEVNRLDLGLTAGRLYDLVDPAGITPGRGCIRPAPSNPTLARCEVTADDGTSGVTVDARDRDDSVRAFGVGGTLRGGAGDDVLEGGDLTTTFEGGAGRDTMTGGADRDFFDEGGSPKGPDQISGGGDEDGVIYSGRRRKVRADLQGDADDGEVGERDRIGDDVENLIGGRGNDRLTGNLVQNVLIGNGGSDLLKAAGGDDELWANDEFGRSRRRTRDRLYGSAGRDTLNGSQGGNRMSGGPGPDRVYGEGGHDLIRERDGRIDRIQCGRGRDRASLDGFDFFADRCERVRRSFLPAAVPLGLDVTDRTVSVDVGCPRDASRGCPGRALLERRGRTLGNRRFRVRRARREDVAVRLPGSAVEDLRPGGRLTVIVRSLDALGRTRIIRARLDLPAF